MLPTSQVWERPAIPRWFSLLLAFATAVSGVYVLIRTSQPAATRLFVEVLVLFSTALILGLRSPAVQREIRRRHEGRQDRV